jgi:MFS family permease
MSKEKSIYSKDVILVMIAAFLFMSSTMFMNPLVNGYAKSLGATSAFAGLITGIMTIAAMFLRPIAGNLADRFSKYSLSFIGGILIVAGVIGYIFTPSSSWLLLFRVINGVGYVLCTVCMATWIADLVPRSHVGEAMGLYGLMNALAMALSPAISINLYHVIGYRNAIWLSVCFAASMVIIIQFVGNHSLPVKIDRPDRGKRSFKLIQKDAIPVAILTTLFALPYFTTQADIVTYAEQRHLHIAVGFYFLIYSVVLLLIRLFLKRYFDTVPFGPWLWLSTITTAFYIMMNAIMQNNWQMALAAGGMAFGYGVIYSVNQSTALLLAPVDEQGLANATFYLGLDIGMAFGPILSGLVDSYLPISWFYPIELVILPLAILVYLTNRKKLNNAINNH